MPYRKRGTLIALERAILEVAVRRTPDGVYGFALAQDLAGDGAGSGLVAHGTLYKALDRLRRDGLLEAAWEDADSAATEGRPRRRLYTVTAAGQQALAGEAAPGRLRPGEAPA
jgi:DNA-binding PadR family transcriptional regulator